MSDFSGFILTKRGQALLAKLQAGGQLTFTRVFTGSGRMPPDNNVFSAVAVGVGVTITNSEVGAAGAADVDTGFTVVIATPGSAGVAQVATVQCLAASELAGGEYFTLSSPYLLFHVWFTKDGVGSDPAPAGSIGIRVDLAAGNTAIAVAAILATTLDSHRLDLSDLCCLITARQDLAVQSVGRVDDAVSEIKVILTNAGLAVGYDLCEIGIFATDPDVGEILYAVTNAGDQGDYFPAEGGATLIEAELSLRTIIAAAAELSMVIKAEAYAGLAQFIAHTGEAATEAVKGHMQFATLAETLEGLLTSKAVHPAGVKAAIDALINLAPEALNDLNELSAALGDDPNYATTMLTALAGKAALGGSDTQLFAVAQAVGASDAVPLSQLQTLTAAALDASITVTVGAGGNYATINEALEAVSKYYPLYKAGGVTATINLLTGFVMAEQVRVVGVDLGWIKITSVDAVVAITRSALTTLFDGAYPAFGALDGGRLPKIGALFQMDTSGVATGRHGVYCNRCATAEILSGCGVKSAGANGLSVQGVSMVSASGSNFSNASICGVFCQLGGVVEIQNSVITGCGTNVSVQHGGRVNATGITATGGITYGVESQTGGSLNLYGANAQKGGSPASTDIVVSYAGTIAASAAMGGLSQAANTITTNGIIFQ